MTPREKYEAMGDGRHEGLLDIEPADDAEAFRTWYETRTRTGHPWEICRGGNTTHISLQMAPEEEGWRVYLSGFSAARCVETVRMAVALHGCDVPIVVVNGPDLLRMVRGEDFVGIVPTHVLPRYCHGFFPAQDRVNDFIHLDSLGDAEEAASQLVDWYPISLLKQVKHRQGPEE
jgi:hypothetical protein